MIGKEFTNKSKFKDSDRINDIGNTSTYTYMKHNLSTKEARITDLLQLTDSEDDDGKYTMDICFVYYTLCLCKHALL